MFQSTLPVWGATLNSWLLNGGDFVSIHAPRVGSDQALRNLCITLCVSIHAPRVGSDRFQPFQSLWLSSFNPRSPCGERRCSSVSWFLSWFVSIHAPRVGSDQDICLCVALCAVSIHAPRVGSDETFGLAVAACRVSIHAPRVGSDSPFRPSFHLVLWFQSTLPVWGATATYANV